MAVFSNTIYVGSLTDPMYVFRNEDIHSVPSMQAVALVGQDLSIDTFSPVVSDTWDNVHNVEILRAEGAEIVTADGQILAIHIESVPQASDLRYIPYGTPVWYYNGDNLIGKFYIDHITRQAANKYELNCVSAIGLLDRMQHAGGLYRSATFGDVLADILAGDDGKPVIDYICDFDVATVNVTGWLPHDTKRNNLYQLIFANGVNIIKSPDGTPQFTFIHAAAEDSAEIADADIFLGGSVDYQTPYSKVDVTEHTYAYVPDDQPVSLYDNSESDTVVNEQIWFSKAPVYVPSITATEGLTIHSVTENGAVVSGNGKITGIPYVHATKTITMRAEDYTGEEKIVSVANCTLVSLVNSNNLALRLYNFYCQRPNSTIKIIKNSIRVTDQRCGKPYRFTNPFGEQENAYLAEMDITASSFNRAECVFYADYEPAGQMGLYHNCVVLTGSGTWQVPEGVEQIYAVLIGGGQGGASGFPGANGSDASGMTEVNRNKDLSKIWYGAEGGSGGKGGAGGQPGRVFKITIPGESLAASYVYSCGTGGDGGAETGFLPDTESELRSALEAEHPNTEYSDTEIANMVLAQQAASGGWASNPGSPGTVTRFGSFSSDDTGSYIPQAAGVYEPISARYFAQPGKSGEPGGKGGARKIENNDGTYVYATDGETVTFGGIGYAGGRTGNSRTASSLPEAEFVAYGGNGAGAAVGLAADASHGAMNGGSAPEAYWTVEEDT